MNCMQWLTVHSCDKGWTSSCLSGTVLTAALQKAWRSGSAGFLAGTMQVPCVLVTHTHTRTLSAGDRDEAFRRRSWNDAPFKLYRCSSVENSFIDWKTQMASFKMILCKFCFLFRSRILYLEVNSDVFFFHPSSWDCQWRRPVTYGSSCLVMLTTLWVEPLSHASKRNTPSTSSTYAVCECIYETCNHHNPISFFHLGHVCSGCH